MVPLETTTIQNGGENGIINGSTTVMSDRAQLIKKDTSIEGGIFRGLIQPCLAEFVATTLFVFIGTLAVFDSKGLVIEVALAHGLTIAVLVRGTADISGGHLNPAVTLGVFLSGGINILTTICYILSQLLGAILGAALTKGCLTDDAYKAIHGGCHILPDYTTVGQGVLCEIVITTILVLTVMLNAVDDERKNDFAPLVIGVAVAVGILAAANVSGASMNPARSFGPAVVDSSVEDKQWDYHYVYWVGPACGSLLAAFIYRLGLAGPSKHALGL